MSPQVSGLDTDIPVADLARRSGMPGEPEVLGDLRAAVGAYTGFGAASPATAEIIGGVLSAITAAVTAAIVLDRLPPGSGTVPHLSQAPRPDMSASVRAWRDLTADKPPLYAVRDGLQDVTRMPALPKDGQMCAVLAVDIAGFTRPDRDDDIRRYLHEKLYECLRKALNESGIPWDGCFWEDRGDGALIVVPPEFSFKALIDPFPEKLRILIRRHNHVSREAAAIQLRAAAHIGPVDHDGHGFVGTDVNFLFRMLDARPLKRLLASSGAELALVVSDYVYRSLVCRYPSLVHPDTFRTVRFQTKNTRARAWTYLPGSAHSGPVPD